MRKYLKILIIIFSISMLLEKGLAQQLSLENTITLNKFTSKTIMVPEGYIWVVLDEIVLTDFTSNLSFLNRGGTITYNHLYMVVTTLKMSYKISGGYLVKCQNNIMNMNEIIVANYFDGIAIVCSGGKIINAGSGKGIFVLQYKDIEYLEKQKYDAEAKKIKLEQERIENEKYQSLIESGKKAELDNDYFEAKNYYQQASKLKPEEEFPKNKITEIEKKIFLIQRRTTIYDYQEINPNGYNAFKTILLKNIQENFREQNNNAHSIMDLTFFVDTIGKNKLDTSIFLSTNQNISNDIINIARKNKMETVFTNDYTVLAKSKIPIDLSLKKESFKINTYNGKINYTDNVNGATKSKIENYVINKPNGYYDILIATRNLNGTDFSSINASSYKSFGGPANAFLSLLVPGLGNRKISGNNVSGLGTTVTVYGCLALGTIFTIISNNQYEKYHSANTQDKIDQYYNSANTLHKSGFVFLSVGAGIWIYDIVKVASRGHKNKIEEKKLKL